MENNIKVLHDFWLSCQNKAKGTTILPQVSFNEIASSIFSTGDSYYYIVDFYDMSIAHVSQSINNFHGFNPNTVAFDDVLNTIHPDDIEFVNKAEAASLGFIFKNFDSAQILSYKMSYNFRSRMKNGEYALLNHQALILTLDENGGYGKSLNIHTRIDHLGNINPTKFSLIGLNGNPSYLNLDVDENNETKISFSKREIDIIKLIAEGHNNKEIAEKLFISVLTVKKHRSNILSKSDCKNMAQLIKKSLMYGMI